MPSELSFIPESSGLKIAPPSELPLAVEGELDHMAELVEEHGRERLIPDYFFEFDEVRPRPHKLPLRDVVGMGEVPEPLPSP